VSPIIASFTRGEFSPAPEGLHQAVCIDVVDKGMQQTAWGEKHKVQVRWVIDAVDEKTGRQHMVTSSYTLSLHKKALLRQHLEAWRGKRFTDEELKGFDLERLIGVNCQLQIVHSLGEENTVYSNVQAIVPLGKGMPQMAAPGDYVRVIDRENQQQGRSAFSQQVEETPF